jgi:hypothetical protein
LAAFFLGVRGIMKKFVYILPLCAVLGCAWFNPSQKNTAKITKAEQKIEQVATKLDKNEENKKTQVAALMAGAQRSLNQISNDITEVKTAQSLNERVISIVGSPKIDDLQRINLTVDLLNSVVAEERAKGEKLLKQRDSVIATLQNQNDILHNQHNIEVEKLNSLARDIAKEADKSAGIVGQVNSYFGLGGVFYGFKRFISAGLIFIVIFLVLFFILRLAASSNPIAAAIFSVFDVICSWFINFIKLLAPKAKNLANLIDVKIHDEYKDVLYKIIKGVQDFKDSPQSDGVWDIKELNDNLSSILNDKEKAIIENIKKDMLI